MPTADAGCGWAPLEERQRRFHQRREEQLLPVLQKAREQQAANFDRRHGDRAAHRDRAFASRQHWVRQATANHRAALQAVVALAQEDDAAATAALTTSRARQASAGYGVAAQPPAPVAQRAPPRPSKSIVSSSYTHDTSRLPPTPNDRLPDQLLAQQQRRPTLGAEDLRMYDTSVVQGLMRPPVAATTTDDKSEREHPCEVDAACGESRRVHHTTTSAWGPVGGGAVVTTTPMSVAMAYAMDAEKRKGESYVLPALKPKGARNTSRGRPSPYAGAGQPRTAR